MEIFRALAALLEAPAPEHERLAKLLGLPKLPTRAEHTELTLFQLPPYASIYLGHDGKAGGEARDRVAGFWRALGHEAPEEPDHLAALLSLYAGLIESESRERSPARRLLLGRAARAVLWEHLLSWVSPYLTKLSDIGSPFYRVWGELLAALLAGEARAQGALEVVPLQLREAIALPDPREAGANDFISGILTPRASGMVLVNADLRRAARELELARRAGERGLALAGLLSQDARGVLAWLEEEAWRWTDRHNAEPGELAPVAEIWAAASAGSAHLLAELREVGGYAQPEAGSVRQ